MTVSTESTLTSYSGDGITTDFATGFPFFDAEDLVVVVETTSTNAQAVQTLGTDYTVSGGQVGDGSPATGTVSMTAAPEAGETLHIYRAAELTQDTNLVDNTAQRASVTEATFDRLATYVQEIDHRLDRAIRLPEIGGAVDALKGAYERRDTVVGFDDDGNLALVAQSALGGDGSGGGGGDGVWGSITGTLSDQTDLQNALDAKADVGATVAWGDITGTLSNQTDLQTALDAKLASVSIGDINASGTPSDGDFLGVSGGALVWTGETPGSLYTSLDASGPDYTHNASDLAFSPDGVWLAVAALDPGTPATGVFVYQTSDWTLATSELLSNADSCTFSPNNSQLAVGRSNSVTVLETTGWTSVNSHTTNGDVEGCAYSPNGNYLALAFLDTTPYLTVLDTSDWSVVSGTPTLAGNGYGCAFSPDNSRLAVAHDGSPYLTVIDTSDWSTVSGTPTLAGLGRNCAFSNDGAYLAVAHAAGGGLTVLDTSDWSVVSSVPALPSTGYDCVFTSDDAYLAVAVDAAPGFVLIATSTWSILDGTYEHPGDDSRSIAIKPDDSLIALGGFDAPDLALIQRAAESAVTSVNGQTGDVTLNSDNISEGSTNEYHTDARAVAAIKADADWNATDWDAAFGWGNHATAGYLTDVDAADLNATNSPADGQVPTYDQTSGGFTWSTAGSGGDGASSFLELSDTPGDYTGAGLDLVRVNSGATGLEYVDPANVLLWKQENHVDFGEILRPDIAENWPTDGTGSGNSRFQINRDVVNGRGQVEIKYRYDGSDGQGGTNNSVLRVDGMADTGSTSNVRGLFSVLTYGAPTMSDVNFNICYAAHNRGADMDGSNLVEQPRLQSFFGMTSTPINHDSNAVAMELNVENKYQDNGERWEAANWDTKSLGAGGNTRIVVLKPESNFHVAAEDAYPCDTFMDFGWDESDSGALVNCYAGIIMRPDSIAAGGWGIVAGGRTSQWSGSVADPNTAFRVVETWQRGFSTETAVFSDDSTDLAGLTGGGDQGIALMLKGRSTGQQGHAIVWGDGDGNYARIYMDGGRLKAEDSNGTAFLT